MIKTGIIGAAGYTGGELIRLLLKHPSVKLDFVTSLSQQGKLVTDLHRDLIGETELKFLVSWSADIDVLFMAGGHGMSAKFLAENEIPDSVKIIDLSRDFRLESNENDFVYGLPELNRSRIASASRIANPGCFASAIQLALLPLAKAGEIKSDVFVQAITGSTGAGQSQSQTTHFSWRSNNLSVYKPFVHQHMEEILQSVRKEMRDFSSNISFIPVRGDFARGIFASLITDCSLTEIECYQLFEEYYQSAPFTLISTVNPDLKQVVNTNKCILHLVRFENKLLTISMLDNLLKGASGQAVQNMNIMFGLEETQGLDLKASVF